MFSSLIVVFFAATRIAAGVTVLGLGVMAVNAIDAIYGERIEKFLTAAEKGNSRTNNRIGK